MPRYLLPIVIFLSACPGFSFGEEAVGRLFFSPNERLRLDRMRQQSGKNFAATGDMIVLPEDIETTRITIDGFVRRSSGKSTTWINQAPQTERDIVPGTSLLQPSSRPPAISLQLGSGKRIQLKAGQVYDANSGAVEDAGVSSEPTLQPVR